MSLPTKKFLVFGYFGGWNSGDEAILISVCRMFSQRCLESATIASFSILCTRVNPEYLNIYRSYGFDCIESKNWKTILKTFHNHQLIIGGGQIITGDKSYKGLLFLLALTFLARLQHRPALMIGIGVEGVHRLFSKWLSRTIVSNCLEVGCRDLYSLKMLEDAGCNRNKLKLTADMVFSCVLSEAKQDLKADIHSKLDCEHAPIVIGLHHSPLREYFGREQIEAIITLLVNKCPDDRIVIVSNDCRARFDKSLLEDIRHNNHYPQVDFLHFESVEKTVGLYALAKCVISVRMHPLILAIIHGRPVVGVGCSNKVIELSRRIEFPLFQPKSMNIEQIPELIDQAISKPYTKLQMLQQMSWDNLKPIFNS